MNNILAITGATGQKSGGVFADHISKNEIKIKQMFEGGVRAIVRQSSNTKVLENNIPGIDIKRGQFDDLEFLKEALKNVDTLVHIAGIHFSRSFVKAAAECKVRRLILVHTTGIYSKYKAAGEEYRHIDTFVYEMCKKNNIILTICRPTMIYGNVYDQNVVKFIKMVDKLPIMPIVDGANYELQPVHYKDLGKAYYDILINEDITANKDFDLSGGKPILLRNMLSEIGKNLGKSVHFLSVPFWVAYPGSWLVYLFSFKRIDLREKVQRLCEPRVYSHQSAKEVFGYSPVTFEEGIVAEVKQYKGL